MQAFKICFDYNQNGVIKSDSITYYDKEQAEREFVVMSVYDNVYLNINLTEDFELDFRDRICDNGTLMN